MSQRQQDSARRPVHLALTQHVHVDVVHGLPAKVVAVHHHTEAFLAALLPGQALGGEEDMACQRPVCLGQVLEGGNVPFRDDQEVHRRLRADIVKRDNFLVFVELARGNFPATILQNRQSMGDSSGLGCFPECSGARRDRPSVKEPQ